ncbi:MAG: hypothetical protein DA408_04280 [Bacteroidetes bacterium]|nr:MAG: hypothetical protein C7N36_12020 [Bacteroidota bacterium]PTM14115.1 MAG: hypothetical protein DA408_04280 [Bacteroidota bacterium]
MKNFTISLEALFLVLLLIIGFYGAHLMLKEENNSPGLASPRQESPAMVLVPQQQTDGYAEFPN